MRRILLPLLGMLVAIAVASLVVAADSEKRPGASAMSAAPERDQRPALTAEQRAYLEQLKELRRQIRIARLELQLAEAKGAPEQELAQKAEQLYRLMGKEYAFRASHRDVAQQLRQVMGPARGHHRGGPGRGQRGMGRGRHFGGRGRWAGGGRGMGWAAGRARGPRGAWAAPGTRPDTPEWGSRGWRRGPEGRGEVVPAEPLAPAAGESPPAEQSER